MKLYSAVFHELSNLPYLSSPACLINKDWDIKQVRTVLEKVRNRKDIIPADDGLKNWIEGQEKIFRTQKENHTPILENLEFYDEKFVVFLFNDKYVMFDKEYFPVTKNLNKGKYSCKILPAFISAIPKHPNYNTPILALYETKKPMIPLMFLADCYIDKKTEDKIKRKIKYARI